MKRNSKPVVVTLSLLCLATALHADTILHDHFDNNDIATDVNGVNGGFKMVSNGSGGDGTASESGSLATVTTSSGEFNNTGIESLNTVDMTADPERGYTVTWVIDSADTPVANGLLFAVDKDTGLWGDSLYFSIKPNGAVWEAWIITRGAGGGAVNVVVDTDVTLSEILDGFTLRLMCNSAGVYWTSTGADSLADGSKTWDELNGAQTVDYDDVFDSTTHISAWIQGSSKNLIVDRITVTPDPVLINDDFSSSTTDEGRFNTPDIDTDTWIGSAGWSVSGGELTHAATTGQSTHLINSVSSTDTSLTKVTLSFDYSVGAGSTLYFYSTLFTGEPGANMDGRTSKTDGTYWANDFANGWDGRIGFSGPEYNLVGGSTTSSSTANAVTSFVGGTSGTFSQTYDISGFGGGDFSIADVSYVLAVFTVNAAAAGDGAISIDNFNMTATPPKGTVISIR